MTQHHMLRRVSFDQRVGLDLRALQPRLLQIPPPVRARSHCAVSSRFISCAPMVKTISFLALLFGVQTGGLGRKRDKPYGRWDNLYSHLCLLGRDRGADLSILQIGKSLPTLRSVPPFPSLPPPLFLSLCIHSRSSLSPSLQCLTIRPPTLTCRVVLTYPIAAASLG